MAFKPPTAADVTSEPGYAFGLDQGTRALDSSASSRGGLYSGNALKKLTQYGQDYAGTKYNDAFQRAQSTYNTNLNTQTTLANAGQGAATQLGNSGANFANSVGNIGMSNANAQGAATIAQGNAWGNLVNQGISTAGRNNWWQGNQGSGNGMPQSYDTSTGTSYRPSDNYGGWADGGPVRAEPKVGTRSPLPTGTGGGLSKSNVLLSLIPPDQTAEKSGIAALEANPVTDPQAILRLRLMRAGAYADGGPVRMEPIVGTRTPLPQGGTGGGLSPAAIRSASAPPSLQIVMTKNGLAVLPANPLTNPKAILEQQLQEAGYACGGPVMKDYMGGGSIHGPGGPRDDAIVAHVSDGEHIFSAADVNAVGGGSNEKGQRRLNALRSLLRHGSAA